MTEERLTALENRMDRVEEVLTSAGNFLMQASELTRQNAGDINLLTQRITDSHSTLNQKLEELTERVNSLAASSERHDRILDYLIKRDADREDGESNGSN